MRVGFWISLTLMALGLAPLFSVLLSSTISSLMGCALHEGFATTCTLVGQDLGEMLSTMFVMGWFFFLTWPLAVGGALGALIFGMRLVSRRGQQA